MTKWIQNLLIVVGLALFVLGTYTLNEPNIPSSVKASTPDPLVEALE